MKTTADSASSPSKHYKSLEMQMCHAASDMARWKDVFRSRLRQAERTQDLCTEPHWINCSSSLETSTESANAFQNKLHCARHFHVRQWTVKSRPPDRIARLNDDDPDFVRRPSGRVTHRADRRRWKDCVVPCSNNANVADSACYLLPGRRAVYHQTASGPSIVD